MKLFDLITIRDVEVNTCRQCIHFKSEPALIEDTYPGLTSMSSGFASVRDRDGLCEHHQLYLSGRDGCKNFSVKPGN